MVLTLAIPIRAIYGLEDFITMRHLQNMAKVMLVTGLIVVYGYMIEAFMAWYSADKFEVFVPIQPADRSVRAVLLRRCSSATSVTPQAAVVQARAQQSDRGCSCIAIIVNIGMWLERFIIIVTSLHRDFAAIGVGPLRADDLGLVDLRRHDRVVPGAAVPVRALPCR